MPKRSRTPSSIAKIPTNSSSLPLPNGQTALTYRTNRDLFSNYYLDEHLPETEEWDEVSAEELQKAHDDVMDLWGVRKDTEAE